jgi:hypothetical protein
VWTGEIPFQWEHAQIQPASRTVGRPARADFLSAVEDPEEDPARRNQLHLMLVIEANNLERHYYTTTKFWVTVIATSQETESLALRLEVAWNGQWNPGEAEMANNLKIRGLEQPMFVCAFVFFEHLCFQ